MRTNHSLAAILVLLAGLTATADEPRYESELIFELESIHNHGSGIVETPNGDLLACWYHGSGERTADDCLIQGARMKRGSDVWSPRFLMADTPLYPDTNPMMMVDSRGVLWLFYATILNNQWQSALLKMRTATKYEQSGPPNWDWQDVVHVTPVDYHKYFLPGVGSRPEVLEGFDQRESDFDEILMKLRDKLGTRLGWFGRAMPIQIPGKNKIILPLYSDLFDNSIMVWTEDWGKTWETGTPIIGYGDVQPSLAQRRDGTLVAYMRDNGSFGFVQTAESRDEGRTWSLAELSSLPNSGASVVVTQLQSGEWLLVNNDTQRGRHSLVAMLSEDEGKTWPWSRHLEKHQPGTTSASYPSAIQARDGMVHVTYSYVPRDSEGKRPGESIKHAAFNVAWVKAGD